MGKQVICRFNLEFVAALAERASGIVFGAAAAQLHAQVYATFGIVT